MIKSTNFRKIFLFLVIVAFSESNYNFFSKYSELKNYNGKLLKYGSYERKQGILYEKKTAKKFTGRTYDLYSNGKLEGTAEYMNGEKNGIQYQYNKNGKLSLLISFENNKRNGEMKKWRENGTLYIVSNYKDNKLISLRKYNEDGETILGRYQIEGDRVKITLYNKNEKVKEAYGEGKIINHEKIAIIEDGIVQSFYPNGKIKTDVLMKDGKGNGPLKTYYEDGTLQLETFVENGKIKGSLAYYYISGNVQLKMDYLEGTRNEDGIINGNVEIYNQNGSIQYKGYFDNVKVSMLLKEEYGDIKNNREFIKLLKRFI